jgi:hypothetical protein
MFENLPLFILISTIVALLFLLILAAIILASKHAKLRTKILKDGESAKAKIIQAQHTGGIVNGVNYGISFVLEVQPKNKKSYQATARAMVPAVSLPKYQPGTVVQVKFNPANPSRVIILSLA